MIHTGPGRRSTAQHAAAWTIPKQPSTTTLAVVLSGRAGAAVLSRLGVRISRTTVLRMLMALPTPAAPTDRRRLPVPARRQGSDQPHPRDDRRPSPGPGDRDVPAGRAGPGAALRPAPVAPTTGGLDERTTDRPVVTALELLRATADLRVQRRFRRFEVAAWVFLMAWWCGTSTDREPFGHSGPARLCSGDLAGVGDLGAAIDQPATRRNTAVPGHVRDRTGTSRRQRSSLRAATVHGGQS